MKKIRVGVVGTGYLGKFHAEKYAQMNDVELIGVVDVEPLRAETVAGECATKAYTDYRDLLDKVDAVSVVVPTSAHYSVSKDFLLHDVDVMIEKPMTNTIDEADELIRISKEKGLIVQVGHLERFNSAVVKLEDIIKRPMFIESHRLSFFKERSTDVSVVLDLMIHDIDIILNFVKSNVESIHAAGISVISENVDIANARLQFESGCVANVTASRISAKNERKIRLFQKDAYISVDFANHDINITRLVGEPSAGLIDNLRHDRMSFEKGDALKDELVSFIKSVKQRQTAEVTGEMGRDALKIAIDIMEQINSMNKRLLGQ
jgi:predicted dehydrogenase